MTIALTYASFSDHGLASGDPAGRPPRASRFTRIEGRDVIYLEEVPAPGEADGYTFTLETSRPPRNEVRSWKGLKFVDRGGRVLAEVGMQGEDHGPWSFTVGPAEVDGGRLVFMRAELFGARTDVYHLETSGLRDRKVDTGHGGLQPVAGLRFVWERDAL